MLVNKGNISALLHFCLFACLGTVILFVLYSTPLTLHHHWCFLGQCSRTLKSDPNRGSPIKSLPNIKLASGRCRYFKDNDAIFFKEVFATLQAQTSAFPQFLFLILEET